MQTFPEITINGVKLTEGQSMTMHVALQNFARDMQKKNALGKDKHGQFMQKNYLERIKEINSLYI